MSKLWYGLLLLVAVGGAAWFAGAQEVDRRVLEAEQKRVAAIDKVKPAVVAIFAAGGQGGGSGVLIDKDGYALTNFHVVEGSGPTMQCGLSDGVLYDGVLVGMDKVGDVALIKLEPKDPKKAFPFAPLGNSDKVRTGDWSLAMGNPFLLATDFNPTVTFGLISGVHRYQYPSGTLLEYTDCIQVDTSINPGNSGGPLFNMDGELIGINGRGSFEKRARINSGVGYAISINQIKNFLGHLRAGLDTDHATLGATVETETDEQEGVQPRLLINDILENSDAHRRGLDEGDELVAFAGRPMTSVNQYKNVLGLFPKGWRVPLTYRHQNEKHEILVRLMQLQRTQVNDDNGPPRRQPSPPRPRTPSRNSALAKMYQPKPGFANYYFNQLERDQLLKGFRQHGDFSAAAGEWSFEGTAEVKQKSYPFKVVLREELADIGPDGKPIARQGTYHLKAETLPALPDPDPKTDQAALHQAVPRAAELLRKHAQSFPQEFWAQSTEDQLKEQILDVQKDVANIQHTLSDALEELKDAGKDRDKEPSAVWRAQYDYTLGKLSSFLAYVNEYNYQLGQLRKEPPPRDPKVHRGWRMVPDQTLQSGADTKKLAREAEAVWTRMIKDYKDTPWEDRARKESQTLLGLKWEATGGTKTMVHLTLNNVQYDLDPLKFGQSPEQLKDPAGSGGLLMALYQYRRLLTLGPGGFEQYAYHGGREPFYPYPPDGSQPKSLADLRVDTEVMQTEHNAVPAKWYFALQDQALLGFEIKIEDSDDPCEVYLSDYRPVEGRQLPHRLEVRYKDQQFGVLNIQSYQLGAAH